MIDTTIKADFDQFLREGDFKNCEEIIRNMRDDGDAVAQTDAFFLNQLLNREKKDQSREYDKDLVDGWEDYKSEQRGLSYESSRGEY